MVKTFDPNVTVQYQTAHDPQAPWEQGTVEDFCEAIGLDPTFLLAPGADDSIVLQMPDAVVDVEVVVGSILDEHLARCVGYPTVMFLSNKDGVPTVSIIAYLDPKAEDPDVTNGLWLEDLDTKALYILPVDDVTEHDEIVGPDDEIADALMKLWIEFTDPRDIPAERYEALGLTKVDDVLKRWSAEDGHYHA